MRDEDSLIEVHPETRWDELERVLKEEWPRTMPVYSFIKTRRRWRKKEEEGTDFKIYSAGSDLKNGFITFGMKGVSSFYVLLHTFEGRDPGILVDAVLRSKKINWMDHSCFCILADQAPWIRTMMKSLGLTISKDLTTNVYQLPTEKALAVDTQCPPGVYIAPLKSKDLIKVNEVWPQSFEGAIQYLEDTIKFNPHLGVYNSEDILMSWMMTYEVGDIGVLQTDEKFKRKGYGSLVTRALAKLTAEQGDSVFCMIVVGNEASEKMFKKLDFQLVDGFSLINFEASEKI